MTRAEALAEAQRRWGMRGFVDRYPPRLTDSADKPVEFEVSQVLPAGAECYPTALDCSAGGEHDFGELAPKASEPEPIFAPCKVPGCAYGWSVAEKDADALARFPQECPNHADRRAGGAKGEGR